MKSEFIAFYFLLMVISCSSKEYKLEFFKRLTDNLLAKKSNSRVSYSECLVETWTKIDCGFYGINEAQCYSRGCCWKAANIPGIPWCYHSNSKTLDQCFMLEGERSDCGHYGINDEQCVENGCCWLPSQVPNTPWCFHPATPIDNGKGCGVPIVNPSVRLRIVGGQEAVPHSWPWQVSLRSGSHFCGGSIISPRWVVSAAHCAPALERDSTIGIGKHNVNNEPNTEEIRDIEDYFVHEEYGNRASYDSDIMLIKLASDVEFNDNIQPVCLPTLGEKSVEGTECYVTGWGTLSAGGYLADDLMQVMVPIMSPETCTQGGWYSEQSITENMICAGYAEGEKDSCQGDSGGPLVCHNNGAWTLSGVVSWGEGCAYEHKPGVYANTANFVDWIEKTMAEN